MVTASTTALDDTDEHSTTALYRAAIGDISNAYYLPRFTRYEAADRPGLSWNWAAALNTLNWLIFRQLWHAALVYSGTIVALALLLFGIGKLVFQFSEGMQWGLLAALGAMVFAVPGLGANALYYLATRQKVKTALAQNQTVAEACNQLRKGASTRKRQIVIAVCNVLVLALGAQSYSMFSGFEPLPVGTPVAVAVAPEPRHVASGRAVEAPTPETASTARPPASGPASSPVPKEASAASNPVSAPQMPPHALAASSATAAAASAAGSAPQAVASATKQSASASASPPASSATMANAQVSKSPVSASSATKPSSKATVAQSTPGITPMRSAAAVAAAREVAAAMGQPASAANLASRTASTTPSPSATPVVTSGRFVVNVGLFADSNNARNAVVKLSDADLPVVSKEVRYPKGSRTRVQVGPFDTLAEADAAADKVRALELEARVAPAP